MNFDFQTFYSLAYQSFNNFIIVYFFFIIWLEISDKEISRRVMIFA